MTPDTTPTAPDDLCPRCGAPVEHILFGLPGPPVCPACLWSPADDEDAAAGGETGDVCLCGHPASEHRVEAFGCAAEVERDVWCACRGFHASAAAGGEA